MITETLTLDELAALAQALDVPGAHTDTLPRLYLHRGQAYAGRSPGIVRSESALQREISNEILRRIEDGR